MLREDKRAIDRLHLLITGALIVAAYSGLYLAMRGRTPPLLPFHDYLSSITILTALILAALSQSDLSTIGPFSTVSGVWKELAVGFGFSAVGYGFIAYTLKIPHLSRLFLYGGLTIGYGLSAAWFYIAFRWHRRSGSVRELRRVLLVGAPRRMEMASKLISERPDLGLTVAIALDVADDRLGEIERLLDAEVVDYALFMAYREDPARVEKAMLRCQERGIEVWFQMDLMHREIAFSRVDYLEDMPLMVFSLSRRDEPGFLFKRLLDIALSSVLIVLLAPIMLFFAIAVLATSWGPVLYRQRRVGLQGREFTLLKFRSMRADRPTSLDLRNEMKGPVFKMAADPRVTPIGHFMRKYSIDELPQLWNVLVGDMSLVGPRPPLPEEVNGYEPWQRRRLSMRPGITGLWQVGGRNSLRDFNDWVRLDLKYIDDWSLWLDFRIIFKTIPVVLRGTGI